MKRTLRHARLFLVLAATAATITTLGVGLIGLVQHSAAEGVRAEFASLRGAAGVLELSVTRAPDAGAQDDRMRAAIGAVFPEVPLHIHRTLGTPAGSIRLDIDGTPREVAVRSLPDLEHRAELVEGEWPRFETEVSIQADAASRFSIAPGDRIRVGEAQVTVTALWRANDVRDPRWVGDSLIASGADQRRVGPVVVEENAWAAIGASPTARWAIVPDAPALTPADVGIIASSASDIGRSFADSNAVGLAAIGTNGRLAASAVSVMTLIQALTAVQPAVLITLLVVSVVALFQLARILSAARESETALLWSRGVSPVQLAGSTAASAGVAAGLGAGIAAAGTAAALTVTAIGVGVEVWAVPLSVAAVAAAVFGLRALADVTFTIRPATGASGRARSMVGAGTVALVAGGAALACWQLSIYGSPLTPVARGSTELDPVVVLAPSLILLAIVLHALALFPLIAGLIDRAARSSSDVRTVLALRTVSRRLTLAATPIVLVALACGQIVFAAGYSGTWAAGYTQAAELRAGSDIRIPATTEHEPGMAPIVFDSVRVGPESAAFVAATPLTMRELATTGDGTVDPMVLAEGIGTDLAGAHLPPDAGIVTVRLDTVTLASTVDLVTVDDWGQTDTFRLDRGAEGTYAGEVDRPSALRVAAIDLHGALAGSVTVRSIEADTDPVALSPAWVTTEPTSGLVRLLPSFDGQRTDSRVARLVLSQAFADRVDASIGSLIPLDLGNDRPINSIVTAVVPAIPGADQESAVLMDLHLLTALHLRERVLAPPASVFWASSAPANSDVLTLATDPTRQMMASAAIALWTGAAGSALLAILAVGAVVVSQLRSRRHEVVVLRTVGFSGRMLSVARQRELLVMLAWGLLSGVVAGAVCTAVTVTAFARAAIPGRYSDLPTLLRPDLPAGLVALAIMVLLLVLVAAGYGARVRTQTRTLSTREDDR